MRDAERRALSALRGNWTLGQRDVWQAMDAHVNGLNDHAATTVLAGFEEARVDHNGNPLGVVITGQNGTGKTHLMRWIRQQVQSSGGYFFQVSLHSRDFWCNVADAFVSGLRERSGDTENQLTTALRRLADHVSAPDTCCTEILGSQKVRTQAVEDFIVALRRKNRELGVECQHSARALLMLASDDLEAEDIANNYLRSASEGIPGERRKYGIHPQTRTQLQLVRDISRLLALTGPILVAVDQIDALIVNSGRGGDRQHANDSPDTGDDFQSRLLDDVAVGLMDLRDVSQRTLTVVVCLPNSWDLLVKDAVNTFKDRFRPESRMERIPSAAAGEALVAAHFAPRFARVPDFDPPYPTWPVSPGAFGTAQRFTARGLLMRVDAHVSACQDNDLITTLMDLADPMESLSAHPVPAVEWRTPQLTALDAELATLVREADVSTALDPHTEDEAMATLLATGLRTLIAEKSAGSDRYAATKLGGARTAALHARLIRILDELTGDQLHWSFRAIADTDPRAVLSRIKRAWEVGGLNVPKYQVILLRTADWKRGRVTNQKIDEFLNQGGMLLDVEPADLRVFRALETLWNKKDPAFLEWLRLRRPASETALFRAVFGDPGPATPSPNPPGPVVDHDDADQQAPAWPTTDSDSFDTPPPNDESHPSLTLPLGRLESGAEMRAELESLRKHTVIFAGSGSGKTVLIKRIIEECALRGVSAIVLDPNNDLARLGDVWPEPPSAWSAQDSAKATEYHDGTEVVVWTPRLEAGRPICFQPLPDFGAVRDDPDEFGMALDTAVAALAPRAKVDGATAKAERGRAILREALAFFAQSAASSLTSFLELLADLPEGVSSLANPQAQAADMAQTLTAAMINDPLFGGSGVPLDPGELLTPGPGKRARVSVISLIGLRSNEQRQSFVNQLQMTLFAWIKLHPAGDRPLGGLFVMDEAQTLAPSGAMTPCTESTLALASQARKYGLGLVFATQAPKGIHNRIAGNASTQFFGFLNSPVQIAAAKEISQAKGSGIGDIARLMAGQFYAVSEGMTFQKLTAPMCLSHHPKSALTQEEVLIRARNDA